MSSRHPAYARDPGDMLLLRGSDGARDGARRSGAFSESTIAFGIFAANVAIHLHADGA